MAKYFAKSNSKKKKKVHLATDSVTPGSNNRIKKKKLLNSRTSVPSRRNNVRIAPGSGQKNVKKLQSKKLHLINGPILAGRVKFLNFCFETLVPKF
jgi:hypothetical protein